uniref:Glutamate 5-kinase n=1 Tax=uncultured bacterium contig00025 TaxID=1181514 RepID=A0A806K106_9BACT|nr:glutamate 5-kinase [uncultured bacterium contig00025]
MDTLPCRQRLSRYKRVVVKIGTTSLTYPNGRLNLQRIEKLCLVLSDLCNQGREILLVSSGAIAVGAERLGMNERPRDLMGKQAASAVGQATLMQIYQQFFSLYNRNIAQILLTRDVVDNPIRKQNARNTFNTLLAMGIIPVVNENDAIATDEIESGQFSENDGLSAHVAVLSESRLLVMLSDREGLYNADPKITSEARIFHEVYEITPELRAAAGAPASGLGTGGMATKLAAAQMVMENNIDAVIASGDDPAVLWRLMAGERVGTFFSVYTQ